MNETVAALKKYLVRIGREGVEVERPFGRLLQPYPYLSPLPLSAHSLTSAANPCTDLPDWVARLLMLPQEQCSVKTDGTGVKLLHSPGRV